MGGSGGRDEAGIGGLVAAAAIFPLIPAKTPTEVSLIKRSCGGEPLPAAPPCSPLCCRANKQLSEEKTTERGKTEREPEREERGGGGDGI